jgi:hypothetical protein
MISKKAAAGLLAMVLGAAVVALKQCDDNTPLVPSVPVVVAADAGV